MFDEVGVVVQRLLGVVLVLVIIVVGCGDDDDESAVLVPAATKQQAATTTEPATEAVDASGVWDPILATTRAGEAPTAATCPDGTDPGVAGPSGQKRPVPGWVGNGAAAFDSHAGRVVYVDGYGATWTFDVCANTWELMDPMGTPMVALRESSEGVFVFGLVYDVDSDVTIAMGYSGVAVYDATTNTWTEATDGLPGNPWGMVYDPVSGLILANAPIPGSGGEPDGLWAFDVDTDRWSLVGSLPPEAAGIPLIGYVTELDLLVFQIYETAIDPRGAVVDPRTGQGTPIDGPLAEMAGAFGSYIAGTDTHTTYVQNTDGAICGLDPATSQWSPCVEVTGETRTDYSFAAIVGDPINDRLVLINGLYGNWWVNAVDTIWAMEPDSGTWTRILAPSVSVDEDEARFSFANDDLCKRVTEDDVAEFVAAEYDWDGTATVDADVDASEWGAGVDCRWELSSTDGLGVVLAGDAELWRDMDGNVYGELLDGWGVVDYEDGALGDGSFTGHPALSQGVVVHRFGFVEHAFGVPPEIEWRATLDNPRYERIGHVPPETEWLSVFVEVPGTDDDTWEAVQAQWLAVADHFLEDLGWLPAAE